MQLHDRIEAARARWNVLAHPFYTRWERGELSRSDLRLYAAEYRHAVVALARTARAADRLAGDGHAVEEEAHVALWDAFADELAAPAAHTPEPETRACVESWTAGDPLAATAILYAIESAQPEIAATKLSGLVGHYGFDPDGPAVEYFRLHRELDLEHAARARELLERHAREADADRLAEAAESALRGNWRLLDGVERAIAA